MKHLGPGAQRYPNPHSIFKKIEVAVKTSSTSFQHTHTQCHLLYHTPWQTTWVWAASYHCILISFEEGKVRDWAQKRRGHTEVQVGCLGEHWWGSQLSPANNLLPAGVTALNRYLGVKDLAKMHTILTCAPLACWFIDLKGSRTC